MSIIIVINKFWQEYTKVTPRKIKIIDSYLFYIFITGIYQFIYCCLVGTFPFNSFLSGFVSSISCFILAECEIQIGQGGGTNNPRFLIQSETSRFYQRFGLEGVEIQGCIANVPEGYNILEWLESAVRELHTKLVNGRTATNFIGITMDSNSLNHGPLWLSYRPIHAFNADELWNMIFNVTQSGAEFGMDNLLTFKCNIVNDVRGAGCVALNEESVSKKSILSIKNDDNLCLPRSLVTSYAYHVRGQIRSGELHERWNSIRRSNSSVQKKAALDLVRQANVNIPASGCGLDEIHNFQKFFAPLGVALVIYSFRHFGLGYLPIYDGVKFVIDINKQINYTLRIMYHEKSRHYQPILNLLAASGSRGYCIPCNKTYKNVEDHRCSNKCYKCMKIPACEVISVTKKCLTCLRDFFGDHCFENHLRKNSFNKSSSVCEMIRRCVKCLQTVRSKNRNKKHECEVTFCKVCKDYLASNHFCYIKPIKNDQSNAPKNLYFFYDFETQQTMQVEGDENKKIHIVNLGVVQQACTFCLQDTEITNMCSYCGIREYVFTRDPVKEFVELAVTRRDTFSKIVCIAHNAQGFDAQFIFKYLVEKYCDRVAPTVILNGSKIISMTIMNVKFIDSLNFFHMPLSSLPKAFGLSGIEKGTFPHFFNTAENENYVGPLPPTSAYGVDTMGDKERAIFLEWYTTQTQAGYVFNFKEEIVKYCKQDVNILRLACLTFREMFIDYSVDPFIDCTTIASTCLRVYRKNFLKDNQIGVVPSGGYRRKDNQSVKAIQWLYWMEQKVLKRRVIHAGKSREKRLLESILVDGYCEPNQNDQHRGIVLQFHGCFWHGCPRCHRINRDKLLSTGETMDKRYEKTCFTSERIKTHNYELIEIWECTFQEQISSNDEMKNFLKAISSTILRKPLDPRDAFFGGRTDNNVKIYDCNPMEKIKYVDVCSLYPYICKRGKYPLGHPTIYVGEEECYKFMNSKTDISKVDGLIMCDILPPRNLYHPVLPVRMHGKLIFPLCRMCCEQLVQVDCPHNDTKDRVLSGTWVSEEVKKAIEMGYVIIHVYEIWKYEMTQYDPSTKTGGIFTEYINEFFKRKTEASGYPPECLTDDDKNNYLKDLESCEGIRIDKNKIKFNPALRYLAKLCLNSLWGKLAQRENMSKTEVIKDPKELVNLLVDPEISVNSIVPANDETVYTSWCYKNDNFDSVTATNVVVAAFTTAQARLKLFGYLQEMGPSVLYYDTDSVFYVSKPGANDLPTGTMLGDLTDEMSEYGTGTYITSFISGGPKFYAYKYKTTAGDEYSTCKVKGIRLNYNAKQLINFRTVRQMIEGDRERINVNTQSIRRTRFHDVISQPETKMCRPVYGKRKFIGLNKSLPYGYTVSNDT